MVFWCFVSLFRGLVMPCLEFFSVWIRTVYQYYPGNLAVINTEVKKT